MPTELDLEPFWAQLQNLAKICLRSSIWSFSGPGFFENTGLLGWAVNINIMLSMCISTESAYTAKATTYIYIYIYIHRASIALLSVSERLRAFPSTPERPKASHRYSSRSKAVPEHLQASQSVHGASSACNCRTKRCLYVYMHCPESERCLTYSIKNARF